MDTPDTFDAMFNLYQKGSIDIEVILKLLNMDVPMTDPDLRLKQKVDKLEAVLDAEHKKRLEMFVNLQQRSELLGDALTKVSAFLTESRQENEQLRAKLNACFTAARCQPTQMPVAVGIDEWSAAYQAIDGLQKAYRKAHSSHKRFEDIAVALNYWRTAREQGILDHGENPTFTIKPGPLTGEHLKSVFDMLKDQGEPPRMVVMNLVDLYQSTGFGPANLQADFGTCSTIERIYGHLGTIWDPMVDGAPRTGVPVYCFREAGPPPGEFFVLADRNNPKGMNVPSVRGFVKVFIESDDA